MTAPIKPRRVDFCAGDWLGGTVQLSLNQRGLYITACAMIYEAAGPIRKDDLRNACSCRLDTFNSLLLALVDKGKLQLRDGMIDQVRCEREIEKAVNRISDRRRSGNKTDSSFRNSDRDGPAEMTDRRRIGDKSAEMSPHVLNETNDIPDPHARAKGYQATKEDLESYPEPSESVAAREVSIDHRELGRSAPSGEPHPPPESEAGASGTDPPAPPTPEQIAEVDALVRQATAALRGGVPKGVRDAAAYGAAIKDAKFANLVKNLNAWAGSGLDGEARMSAWEVLAAAEEAGGRAGMTRAARRNFDRLDAMFRATGPPPDLAQAA